ncbi:hypothetical protein ACFLZM_07530 [Thermodesulfobacteriota bacterium]
MKIKHILWTIFVGFFLIATGCGGAKISKHTRQLAELQKPVIIEKTGSSKRPGWTSNPAFFKDDSGFHFTGGFMRGADYALTIRMAKAEAIKNMLESIEIKARSEFGSVMQGSNRNDSDIGRYVTDAVAWTIENIRVRGIKQRQVYYEQCLVPSSQSVKYNAWVELEISASEYTRAKTDAAERLLNKAIQENDQAAKEKALELLEKLRTEA